MKVIKAIAAVFSMKQQHFQPSDPFRLALIMIVSQALKQVVRSIGRLAKHDN